MKMKLSRKKLKVNTIIYRITLNNKILMLIKVINNKKDLTKMKRKKKINLILDKLKWNFLKKGPEIF